MLVLVDVLEVHEKIDLLEVLRTVELEVLGTADLLKY